MKPILLVLLIGITICEVNVTKVYELNQFVTFKGPKLHQVLGCSHPGQLMLGTFVNGYGAVDALSVGLGLGQVGISLSCINKKSFALVFGRSEDYNSLIKMSENTVVQQLRPLQRYNIIINWQIKPVKFTPEEFGRSKDFLKNLLNAHGTKPYLRVPVSLLCRQMIGKSEPYHAGLEPTAFIVQFFGTNATYNSYEDLFTKTDYNDEKAPYSPQCPQFPSFKKLSEIMPRAKIFPAMTLKQHIQGYVWNYDQLLTRANTNGFTIDKVFYDDYPPNMLLL